MFRLTRIDRAFVTRKEGRKLRVRDSDGVYQPTNYFQPEQVDFTWRAWVVKEDYRNGLLPHPSMISHILSRVSGQMVKGKTWYELETDHLDMKIAMRINGVRWLLDNKRFTSVRIVDESFQARDEGYESTIIKVTSPDVFVVADKLFAGWISSRHMMGRANYMVYNPETREVRVAGNWRYTYTTTNHWHATECDSALNVQQNKHSVVRRLLLSFRDHEEDMKADIVKQYDDNNEAKTVLSALSYCEKAADYGEHKLSEWVDMLCIIQSISYRCLKELIQMNFVFLNNFAIATGSSRVTRDPVKKIKFLIADCCLDCHWEGAASVFDIEEVRCHKCGGTVTTEEVSTGSSRYVDYMLRRLSHMAVKSRVSRRSYPKRIGIQDLDNMIGKYATLEDLVLWGEDHAIEDHQLFAAMLGVLRSVYAWGGELHMKYQFPVR